MIKKTLPAKSVSNGRRRINNSNSKNSVISKRRKRVLNIRNKFTPEGRRGNVNSRNNQNHNQNQYHNQYDIQYENKISRNENLNSISDEEINYDFKQENEYSDNEGSFFQENIKINKEKENLEKGGYKIIYSKSQTKNGIKTHDSNTNNIVTYSDNSDSEEENVKENEILQILKLRKNEFNKNKNNIEILSNNRNNKHPVTKEIKTTIPWVTHKTIESLGIIKLHYEILDFFNLLKAREEENSLRMKTFNLFNDLIKNKWPNWNVELFGSFPNNIHLPDSDIDVVVLKENITHHKNFNSYIKDSIISESGQLNMIYLELIKKGFVDEIRMVDAKVPIIKIKCKQTQIRMDIT
jgi:hypothetical protein